MIDISMDTSRIEIYDARTSDQYVICLKIVIKFDDFWFHESIGL